MWIGLIEDIESIVLLFKSSLLPVARTSFILSLKPNLIIIHLKRRQIFPRFPKLPLLHSLAHIPMHESPLGKHGIKFMIDAIENFRNCIAIGNHVGRSWIFS